ncbi:MAG: hypothetical protein E6J41_19615 [Chloroflexi bacterium]|nr:MAG: hypothetical protein E6J41_19615 [Chloroflexota bacterium]
MATHPGSATAGGPHRLRPRTPLLAAGATVLAVALIVASVLVGQYIGSRHSPAATPTVTTAPTAGAPSTATPRPTASAVPVPLAGFGTGLFAGGAAISGRLTSVASVRAASQSGYDRFVIDLGSSPLQQYEVRTQTAPRFALDPKGETVTLDGARGVLIVLRGASNHDSFAGATDVHVGLPAIREARMVGDFEGVVSWALGIDGPGYVRVTTLTGPDRLVVDVQR